MLQSTKHKISELPRLTLPSSSSFQDSKTVIKPEANVSTRTWLARLFQLKDKAQIV